MATLLSIDIQYGDDNKHNMGPGCPKLRQFLDEVKPKLSLNFHNPVLMNGHVKQQNGVVYMDESSTNSTIMEVCILYIYVFQCWKNGLGLTRIFFIFGQMLGIFDDFSSEKKKNRI